MANARRCIIYMEFLLDASVSNCRPIREVSSIAFTRMAHLSLLSWPIDQRYRQSPLNTPMKPLANRRTKWLRLALPPTRSASFCSARPALGRSLSHFGKSVFAGRPPCGSLCWYNRALASPILLCPSVREVQDSKKTSPIRKKSKPLSVSCSFIGHRNESPTHPSARQSFIQKLLKPGSDRRRGQARRSPISES